MKTIYILCLVLFFAGCAIIIKRPGTDIEITNATYTGQYCPSGCKADIKYKASTDIELRFLDADSRPAVNSTK